MKKKKKQVGRKIKVSKSRKIFLICNFIFLTITGIICCIPFINLLAISLSDKVAVSSGLVKFWPVNFTLDSYRFIAQSSAFLSAALIATKRVVLGVSINLILIVMTAYPLSKEKEFFRMRNVYSWFFVVTILFTGGMIPTYMVVKYTGLLDSIWALVLPGAVPVFSMLVVMNFFRSLPKELEEAAFIDGASHFVTLMKVILPISKPALATVGLFALVFHWNSWFDGLLYMNRQEHYPLQSYLQTVIINPEMFFKNTSNISSHIDQLLEYVNVRTTKAAQLFVATVPVLVVYPFLQKYFTTGLVMGSVKG